MDQTHRLTHHTLIVVGVTTTVIVMFWLLWTAVNVFLLIFAGVLLAVFLRGLSARVQAYTSWSAGWALAAVTATLVVLFGIGAWLLGSQLATEANKLASQLPQSLQQLEAQMRRHEWSHMLLRRAEQSNGLMSGATNVLSQATGAFSTIFSVLGGVVIVLFLGLYLAAEPQLYRNGVLHLVPLHKRQRAGEVLDHSGDLLWRWLIGRLISMSVVGLLTAAGLWLLGVPLALTLGLIAAILDFIPNVGPLLSVVPAVLITLSHDGTQILSIILLYLAVQQLENHVIVPLVQRRAVSLPPAVVISAQVLLGVLTGIFGLLLATPLAVVASVLIRALYVEDTLGDRPQRSGRQMQDQRNASEHSVAHRDGATMPRSH